MTKQEKTSTKKTISDVAHTSRVDSLLCMYITKNVHTLESDQLRTNTRNILHDTNLGGEYREMKGPVSPQAMRLLHLVDVKE